MRDIPISEFKAMIDSLYQQHPMARVDFVYPKRHAGKERGALGNITTYGVILDSSTKDRAIVRFYLNHAREERYEADALPEPPK